MKEADALVEPWGAPVELELPATPDDELVAAFQSASRWRRVIQSRLFPWITTPVILAVLIGFWQVYVTSANVSKFVLPPPSSVASSFWQEVTTSFTWKTAIWPTVYQSLLGFLLALLVGLVLGFLVGKFDIAHRVLNPFIVGTQVVPLIALVPLFLLWFGFGPTAKVITAALLSFFPMLTNTAFGVQSIPTGMRELFVSLRANPVQRFVLLELPFTLPNILTGARVGIVLATVGAIVAEYLGGNSGLGAYAVSEQNQLEIPQLFGSILIMAIVGFVLYSGIEGLRRVLIPWHQSISD